MSFPALDAFATDDRVSRATHRIYMHLQRGELSHTEPRHVKSWRLAEVLKLRRHTVIASLNWLAVHGYLIEGARTVNNVRTFTLAWSAPTAVTCVPNRPAPAA